MPYRALDGHVGQLDAGARAAQHESAAAHVAAPDEIQGKDQALTEDLKERLDIFAAGDAAEQNVQTIRSRMLIQQAGGAEQRRAIGFISFVDRDLCDGTELLDSDGRGGWDKPGAWNYEERGRDVSRRGGEGICIRHFASKIQPADEGVDFADGSGAFTEFDGEIEACLLASEHLEAHTASSRGRKQEDPMGSHRAL
jgi:hypothetical protein